MSKIFLKKRYFFNDVAWNKISKEIGAEYNFICSFFKSDVLEYKHKESIITLDYYTVSTGNSAITYTRMRSPLTKNSFYFNIYRENIFSSIRKKFGMEDIIRINSLMVNLLFNLMTKIKSNLS